MGGLTTPNQPVLLDPSQDKSLRTVLNVRVTEAALAVDKR